MVRVGAARDYRISVGWNPIYRQFPDCNYKTVNHGGHGGFPRSFDKLLSTVLDTGTTYVRGDIHSGNCNGLNCKGLRGH